MYRADKQLSNQSASLLKEEHNSKLENEVKLFLSPGSVEAFKTHAVLYFLK